LAPLSRIARTALLRAQLQIALSRIRRHGCHWPRVIALLQKQATLETHGIVKWRIGKQETKSVVKGNSSQSRSPQVMQYANPPTAALNFAQASLFL
jgi:hypothetical protein